MAGVNNMQTIYVITKGEYSDYRICAATTDKKRAEKLRELFTDRYDDASVEEYFDGDFSSLIERGLRAYHVWVNNLDGGRFEVNEVEPVGDSQAVYNRVYPVQFRGNAHAVTVRASDENHAIKIAQDLFAQYKYRKEIDEKPV